jgi:two-component system LytT family sensor kinase
MQSEVTEAVPKRQAPPVALPLQFSSSFGQEIIHELQEAQVPGRNVRLRMKIIAAIRSYFGASPVPMRTVLLSAGLLSGLFVFTSFIGRTQMGLAPDRFDWWMQAPIPFLNFFTWALFLPLVHRWSKRWPIKGRPQWKPILLHFTLGLLLCTTHELLSNVVYIGILNSSGRVPWQPEMLQGVIMSLPGGIVQRFMEYGLLLVLLMYMETHRQVREERTRVLQLQNELQTTQLLALKKQLQPHFLYNTLNTVSALMDVDTRSARTVLSRLGQLLRTTLDEERKELVTLLHEVDHVGNYLDIESIRFQDRLQVHYNIPSECQTAMVPGMVLQPLVENSIKHGLDATNAEVCITIEARRVGSTIELVVGDDGRGCQNVGAALSQGGIGLSNVRERLSLLYGGEGSFHVHSELGKGFQVTLSFPFNTQERPLYEADTRDRRR